MKRTLRLIVSLRSRRIDYRNELDQLGEAVHEVKIPFAVGRVSEEFMNFGIASCSTEALADDDSERVVPRLPQIFQILAYSLLLSMIVRARCCVFSVGNEHCNLLENYKVM